MTTQDNNEAASALSAADAVHILRLALVNAECAIKGREHTGFITKALVATEHIKSAASASQSSTPVPRVGGNTSDETCDACGLLPSKTCAFCTIPESAADTGAADAAELDRLAAHFIACVQREQVVAGQSAWTKIVAHINARCAQQREAGRQSQIARIRHLEHERDEARAAVARQQAEIDRLMLEFCPSEMTPEQMAEWGRHQRRAAEPVAALARQPVSEGLTEPQIVEILNRVQGRWSEFGGPLNAIYKFARDIQAAAAVPPATQPVQMILHCPACGLQHIDAPEPRYADNGEDDTTWTNPPHRSHLCHGCGHIWRPADVPTEGVAAIQTRGSNDSAVPPAKAEGLTSQNIKALLAGCGWTDCTDDQLRSYDNELASAIFAARAILAQQAKGSKP